jgi:hypothetical protein
VKSIVALALSDDPLIAAQVCVLVCTKCAHTHDRRSMRSSLRRRVHRAMRCDAMRATRYACGLLCEHH